MIVFPALDLYDGKVVKLHAEGHNRVEKVYGTPGEVADMWIAQGAEWLHVVDLNAALGEGMPNRPALLQVLPRASRAKVSVQWGGGVRDEDSIRSLLGARLGDTGAQLSRLIIGTRAIEDWAWLERVSKDHPDRIVVAIDAAGRKVLVKGWQEDAGVDVVDLLTRAKDLPVAGFLYTNVRVEGRQEGVDWGPVKEVIQAAPKPVIFSGGISSLDEVVRFKTLGAHGIIVGASMYSGRINFAKARDLA